MDSVDGAVMLGKKGDVRLCRYVSFLCRVSGEGWLFKMWLGTGNELPCHCMLLRLR